MHPEAAREAASVTQTLKFLADHRPLAENMKR
jgi:hypothetical protein